LITLELADARQTEIKKQNAYLCIRGSSHES
jgi:hypothetical protein